MNYVKSLDEFKIVNEAFEVHYSDGVRGMQKFNDKNKAINFMKDKIASSKNLKDIAVYNAGSGFHSTADTDAVIAWWGEGSYLDNVAKKDSKLAAKKLDEAVLTTQGVATTATGAPSEDEVVGISSQTPVLNYGLWVQNMPGTVGNNTYPDPLIAQAAINGMTPQEYLATHGRDTEGHDK